MINAQSLRCASHIAVMLGYDVPNDAAGGFQINRIQIVKFRVESYRHQIVR